MPMKAPLFILLLIFSACKSVQTLDPNKEVLADTGELTRGELEKAALKFSTSIAEHFLSNKQPEGIFVALLPTKNDTSEEIPLRVFDNALVDQLLKKNIYTVRTEDRKTAMSEIAFSQSGATAQTLSIGKMTSPNFFIKVDISENAFRKGTGRIIEQTINAELRSVQSQLVVWSDRVAFSKKVGKSGGVGW